MMQPNAVIYLRVSTDGQFTENQEPDCLHLARARGWQVSEIYREHESAVKRRPLFERMMKDARDGQFSHLIVWRLDRFGRRMQGNINDVVELDSVGVQVVSVREPWLDSGGPARNLLLAIFSWLAEEERRVLSERVKAGRERARREGKQFWPVPPSPEKIAAAAKRARAGVALRVAAREQGIGPTPVRKFLAEAAAERVRAGESVRVVAREYQTGLNTLRRVLAGVSYLSKYPSRRRSFGIHRLRNAFLPFAAAREFARKLGFHGSEEWQQWCASDNYRLDIPMRPIYFYREEWKGWPDWLNYAPSSHLSFEDARAFARRLGLKSDAEWRVWARTTDRPKCIPSEPWQAYRGEYKGVADFLGYPRKLFRGEMMPFEQARTYVHGLGFRTIAAYHAWARTSARPRNIAAGPANTYAPLWAGWHDWLGISPTRVLSFRYARKFVRSLGFRSRKEWNAWASSSQRPHDIPRRPETVYASYWRGMPHWLGCEPSPLLPFYKARKLARSLGLGSCAEWWAWTSSGDRPRSMPSAPDKVYREYWRGWRNWLGNEWLRFGQARRYARRLGLRSSTEWKEWARSANRPRRVPSNPNVTYAESWRGWRDWLGKKRPPARERSR